MTAIVESENSGRIEVATHTYEQGEPANIVITGLGINISLGMEEFIQIAEFVLTNSNIVEDDPRLPFVEKVKSMHLVPGWGASWKKRLDTIPFDTTTQV